MSGRKASVPADLGVVEETLLIPLYARAVETQKPDGLLADARAVEMVETIDYDFSRFEDIGSLVGASLRTLVFDDWVRRFLDDSADGTVVELGTGLNTRFERVDNGRVHWFDLDLPDVITLRRAFFVDDDRRRMLAASILDESWIDTVRDSPGPYLLLAEAVLAFLDESEVRRVFDVLAERLPAAILVLDAAGAAMLADQDSRDVLGTVTARMRWSCDDPQEPEGWRPDVRLLDSIDFGGLPDAVWDRLSAADQAAMQDFARTHPERTAAYRINRYRIG
jgi:O-methyltransferase involved in polyketide biosynthesis